MPHSREPGPRRSPAIARVLAAIRRVIGAPDYERYLAHMHHAHPGHPTLTRDEFLRARLEERYSRPGSRCC